MRTDVESLRHDLDCSELFEVVVEREGHGYTQSITILLVQSVKLHPLSSKLLKSLPGS